MTIPILTLDADWEITESYEFKPSEVRLGDNYKETINKSTASLVKTWNVRKTGLQRAEVNDLVAALRLYSGVTPFQWRPSSLVPYDVYLCDQWNVTPIGGGNIGGQGASTYWIIEATFWQDPKSQCLEYDALMPVATLQSVLSGIKTYLLEYTNNRSATSKPNIITSDTISTVLAFFCKYGFNVSTVTKYFYQNYGVSDLQTQARLLLGTALAHFVTSDSSWFNSLGTYLEVGIRFFNNGLGTNPAISWYPANYYNIQQALNEQGDTSQSSKNFYGTFNTVVSFTSGVGTIPSGGSTNGERLHRVYLVYKTTARLATPRLYTKTLDPAKNFNDELEIDYWVSNYEMQGQNLRLTPSSFGEDSGSATTTGETAGKIQLTTNFTGNAVVVYVYYKGGNVAVPSSMASYPLRRNLESGESETFITSMYSLIDAYNALRLTNPTGHSVALSRTLLAINETTSAAGDNANQANFFIRETLNNIPLPYIGQSDYSINASAASIERYTPPSGFTAPITNCVRLTTPTRPYNAFAKWGVKNEGIDFKIQETSVFNVEYFSYKNVSERRILRLFVNTENLFDGDNQTSEEYETWVVADSLSPNPVFPEPIFSGGQCNIRYEVSINIFVYSNTSTCELQPIPFNTSTVVWGPIEDFRKFDEGATSGGCYAFKAVQVKARTTQFAASSWITIYQSASYTVRDWGLVSITSFDGLPDSCGNPASPPRETRTLLNSISLPYLDFKQYKASKMIWYPGFNGHNYTTTQLTPQKPNLGAIFAEYIPGSGTSITQVDNAYAQVSYLNTLDIVSGVNTYPFVGRVTMTTGETSSNNKAVGGFVIASNTLPRNRMVMRYRLTGNPLKFFVVDSTFRGWEYIIPVSTNFTTLDLNFTQNLIYSSYNTLDPIETEFDASKSTFSVFFLADLGDCVMDLQWIAPNTATIPESLPKKSRIFGFGAETNDYDGVNFGLGNVSVTNVDASKKYTPGIINKLVQTNNRVPTALIGAPSPAYQSLVFWIQQDNNTNANNVADFLIAAQDDYAKRNPDYEGAFSMVWYDKDYRRGEAYKTGYEKFNWNGIQVEDNTNYAFHQYLALERTARAWFTDPTFEKAGTITMRFLTMLDQYMKKNNTNRVPTKITNSVVSVTNHDPGCSALVLRSALYANLAGGDRQITFRIMRKCYDYLMSEYQSNTGNVNFGSFTSSQASFTFNSTSYKHNYGKWIAEELITFAELLRYRNQIVYPPCNTNFS